MQARIMSLLAVLTAAGFLGCGGGGGINVNISGPSFPPFNPVQNTDFVASEPFESTLSSTNRLRLVLTGVNGMVAVTGMPAGGSVTISAERRVGSDSLADAQSHLSYLQVQVQEVGNDIVVRTSQPPDPAGRSYQVDYQIGVPASFALSIVNTNGSIELTGMSGDVDTDLVNGSIEATLQVPAGGSIKMTTVNGGIDLHLPLSTSANLSAEVEVGTITVQDPLVPNEMRSNSTLQHTLGAGGATVSLQTTTDSIRIDGVI